MGKILGAGCAAVLLAVNSIQDIRKKEISLCSLLVFGITGVLLNAVLPYQSLSEAVGGVTVGLALLFISAVTGGMVGRGDGLLLCVAGLYLGLWETLGLLTAGLAALSLFAGLGLLSGRLQKKDRLPFVPFLCAAFLLRLCLGEL